MQILNKSLLACLLCSTLIMVNSARSQTLPAATVKKIDSLFKKWDAPGKPGYAIGIVRNDSLIYAKGYGTANLEYNVPISPEIIFHMASVSKQFTAFSIILLAQQGKLNLDDDIHKYLPWFSVKEKITIRNLLNHTSGIRDQWQLLAIAGTRLDDVITQEQIVKILGKQQALNFKPGDEWSYSNSGFTMLAEIVKSITGKTLRQFTDSVIFKPLGMNNTHFHDDYMEIVPNRSYSYFDMGKGKYANAVLSYSNAGATSLFTNVDDMSKWLMNFYQHKVGNQETIDLLTQKTKLNNGKEQNYAAGISNDMYRGQKRFSHDGGDAGYRTNVAVFPDLKMGFIVFSNMGEADPSGKAEQLEDLFIKDPSVKKAGPAKKKYTGLDAAVLKDTASVQKITGDYISDDGAHFAYRLKDKKLYWITPSGNRNLLVKAERDTFEMFNQPDVKFFFSVNDKKQNIVNEFWPDGHRLLVKFDTTHKADKVLLTYTGKYYSPELDCSYGIALKDHKLVPTNAKYDDSPLNLYGDNQLSDNFWWMSNLKVIRNTQNKITGFEVNSGRIRHVWFKKVE